MASIIYLDVDDEITTAAARIRTATETKVALVLPPGSRLATSRINFRLLSREALERNRVLSIVAADGAARAIAASAGLPVHSTVAEFEATLGTTVPAPLPAPDDRPPAPPTEGGRRPRKGVATAGAAGAAAAAGEVAGGSAPGTIETQTPGFFDGPPPEVGQTAPPDGATDAIDLPAIVPVPAASVAVAAAEVDRTPRPEMPPPETRARSSAATASAVPSTGSGRRLPSVLLAIVGAIAVVGVILAVVGYVVLPSAHVVVTPVAVPVGPVDFVVRADPDAHTVDIAGGVIPATRLSQEFKASGEFETTGLKVVQKKATGQVTFTSENTFVPVTIPAGTSVRTGTGVAFVTTQDVTVPRASFATGPARKTVPITAVRAGTAGNVNPGTIIVEPTEIKDLLVSVTNRDATKGGSREESPQISQKDVDAAMLRLNRDLATQFDTWAAAPGDLPKGTTAFPATGHLGSPSPTPDPTTLVGQEVPTFHLEASATGTVVAVDTALIDAVAAGRMGANVPSEHTLKAGSVVAHHDGGAADGDLVDFRVTAQAQAIPSLDAATLREQIKGKSVADARRLLERYGTVTISTWPGFVSSIPTLDARLDLIVNGLEGAPAGSSPNPEPSASAP